MRFQHWVKFNPKDPHEICTNGPKRVKFLSWEHGVSQFQWYSPRWDPKGPELTKTVFIPGRDMAVTGNVAG
jgi:hypothetical protein